jgi:Domain of unknown function (DUF4412)
LGSHDDGMMGPSGRPRPLWGGSLNALALVVNVAFFAAPAAAPPAPRSADVYFEQSTVVRTDGVVQGAGVLSRVWYAGKRMRLEAADAASGPALLLRLDLDRAWRLDPERKEATEIDAGRLRSRSQMDASLAGDLMGGGEDERIRTAALRTPKTIAGHVCRGFRISGPQVVMDLYMADDLPLGVEAFADFIEWSGAGQSMGAILTAVRKLPGFPLQTRSRVTVLDRVHETISTITKIQVGRQPRALFEVPQGYRVVAEPPEPEKE